MHWPLEQVWAALQTFEHAPQLYRSLEVSRQLVPQYVSPWQSTPQLPELQTGVPLPVVA